MNQPHRVRRTNDETAGEPRRSNVKCAPITELTLQARTKHLLLVEDEEAHAELIQLSFESRDDIRLVVVASLEEARASLARWTPDLLIVDSLLPDGRGIELLQDLPEASSPVILLTSHANQAMQDEALAAGAARYVVKSEVTLLEMPQIIEDFFSGSGADAGD